MDSKALYLSKKKTLDEFLDLIQPKDSLCTSIAAGQPRALLNHLSNKKDIEALHIFTGLCAFPYPLFTNPKVHVTSGYYGPIERMLNEAGANMAYMPLAFNAFEVYAEKLQPRVVMTTLSAMDEEGYLSFGVNTEASFVPFLKAARDPHRLAIAEVNPRMPRVKGLSELGDNKIHISELDALVEYEQSVMETPPPKIGEVEKNIAEQVAGLIRTKDTLQFGIGAIPNEVARILSEGDKGDFGIHSELISDGFLTLMESGKITNAHKAFHHGKSLFTFALGSQKLYDWLDERNGKNKGSTLAAPVSYINDPSIIAKNKNMVGINSGFMIDFSGQVSSEAIGEKQYSGVGGQFNFVEGAFHSPGGRNIICIKSSVQVNGKRYSNIVESFPQGSIISTPRHYAQYIVTEYGSVNLFGLTDEERPSALIEIAHPYFRDTLRKQAKERDKVNYKSRLSR
jgi:acyl-CoA hydrolase